MIQKLLEALVSIDKRLEVIEDCLPQLTDKVNDMAAVIADPTGYVTIGGKVETPIKELKKAFDHNVKMEMQSVILDVNFSQAVFMGARLKGNPELAAVFGEAAVKKTRDLLGQADELDRIVDQSNKLLADSFVTAAAAKKNLRLNIEQELRSEMKKFSKNAEAKLEEVGKANQKLEKGLVALESERKKAEALNARLSNDVIVKTKPSSFVSRRRS